MKKDLGNFDSSYYTFHCPYNLFCRQLFNGKRKSVFISYVISNLNVLKTGVHMKKKIKNNNNNNNQKKIIKKLTCESSQGFCILMLFQATNKKTACFSDANDLIYLNGIKTSNLGSVMAALRDSCLKQLAIPFIQVDFPTPVSPSMRILTSFFFFSSFSEKKR